MSNIEQEYDSDKENTDDSITKQKRKKKKHTRRKKWWWLKIYSWSKNKLYKEKSVVFLK